MKRKWKFGVFLCCCLLLVGCKSVKNKNTSTSVQEESTPTVTAKPTEVTQEITEGASSNTTEDSYVKYIFDPETKYQTVDGFGAAYTWYADRLLPKKNAEVALDALFADAKLSILRFKNEYEYYAEDSASNANTMVKYYKEARKRAAEYGEDVIVLMSCWSPPAYLKENNDITGAATLKKDENGNYCYEEYADWWVESIDYYQSKGIQVDYVSIQNECDFAASYDGCLFSSTETDKQASYAKAYLAVYYAFEKQFGENAPKMIGPETMSSEAGTLSAYMKEVMEKEPESIYAMAHHLYVGGDSDEDTNSVVPGSYVNTFMNVSSFFPEYKKWQTEFYIGHAIDTATLINNYMVYANANAYIYWSGVWEDETTEFENGQLVACYNSTAEDDGWRLCADYYALRHFSEFIRPGYTRIKAISGDGDVRTSVYMNEYTTKLAMVLINTSEDEKSFQIVGDDYTITDSCIYQSVFGDTSESADGLFQEVGSLGENQTITLAGKSVVTIDVTGYYGEEAPVTPELTKIELPKEETIKENQEFVKVSENEKLIFASDFNTIDATRLFMGFGSSSAEFEETEGVDGTGCMRVGGRSQDWNGISLGTDKFGEYGYKAYVSYDVMMKESGNLVSATTTFTVEGNTQYPDGKDCRVYQEILEAGVWYHVEGYVTLFSNIDEGSFQLYWESAGNTSDIYLDNIIVKLLYAEPAGEYSQ